MATTATAERVITIRGFPRPLARAMEAYAERLDVDAIREAYELAAEAHSEQRRASGEPYINHAVEVATIVTSLQLDTASVVAALVHDVVEDTVVSLQGIREIFGDEVASIVDGVTKIGKVRFRSSTERQVENYRKLLLSMANDARVILVKLADRLHNMRTLEYLPVGKQKPIARETREIYAPLAHRLGMAAIKWELEDLAFKFLDRKAYDDLRKLVRQRRRARERHIQEMQRPLEDALEAAGVTAEVTGRPKHLWSIHRKMVTQDRSYDDIYDLMALRVITDSVQSCYAALGIIHGRWTPIPERFHDYVATPKSNMYQSIHTTVLGPSGRRYEVQIRTAEMHRTAEFGIAAHWRYKDEGGDSGVDDALTWFRQVLEWQKEASEPEEFMEFLRMDLFQGEIFVFTPKGEVKQLPVDSSPIDFAFSVHTEVGLHCAGAKVNGRIAPLSRKLKSGDSVEIMTNPRQWPNRDWLGFVKTSRARQRIRQWIRREEYDRALRIGQDFFQRELRKARRRKPSNDEMRKGARRLGYKIFDEVLAALARGDIGPAAVIRGLYPDEDPSDVVQRTPSALERIAEKIRKSNRGVAIGGVDNLMVRYSQCCQPVPGDEVIGYITRGRGISVHRTDCPNVLNLDEDPGRRVEIEWKTERDDRFFVHLYMEGTDRRGLLGDVARTISETATDIQHADMRGTDGGMTAAFVVEVQDLNHLKRVIDAVNRVKGVTSVIRRESFGESELFDGKKG
ncbi:MAG: bifunctional (p)ppGpp synthetase/guanosine-3',5'-bis(diphosphate) 3'-pyrophosphohydrolase [Gemmatimonadetes bacterium]|nr:bifunctional (p)ppGpp synthetase/guanosine-3',5'-bis(diphosphate) 3'-pyrophosphohydrolase [Gemmatimonadota bacterium]MXX33528.1 bifunctional (p)ppGpp synthetase/guanosine-3',5'-bis(diphosphate) 3'-pyrophosphohydrolase [Gemmatimonadota bacterium]MYD14002.1 bifunctional (p)ppGpp synthetase/guanosine-3',5'-bis(diphosphate) 3'-pyrophosphohydrolase [Gemmatimonadota bacterium]MYI65158.1 bifunctional (p)ppGpp synthetase/guanosine-3',5'-bis(diphosphate) 3'-pyrophosphohydrolase [Gemmatimonadota bacter